MPFSELFLHWRIYMQIMLKLKLHLAIQKIYLSKIHDIYSSLKFLHLIHNQNQYCVKIFFYRKDSEWRWRKLEQNVHAKFSRSTPDNVLFMHDNRGRRSDRRLCSVSKLRAFRHSLGRLVFFASFRRWALRCRCDILRRFLHNSVGATYKRG